MGDWWEGRFPCHHQLPDEPDWPEPTNFNARDRLAKIYPEHGWLNKQQWAKNRRFSQYSYHHNDKRAKEAVIEYHKRFENFICRANGDRYDTDLLVFHKSGRFIKYIEVTVKQGWKDQPYPWDSIVLSVRKRNQVAHHHPRAQTEVWVLNDTLTRALVLTGQLLLDTTPIMTPCSNRQQYELCCHVPISAPGVLRIKLA